MWILADGNVDSSATMYTVPDLRPAMVYQFRVAAVNEVGEGPYSSPSEAIELPQQRKRCFFIFFIPMNKVHLSTFKYI